MGAAVKTALVLGGAACLWDDINAFWGLHGFDPAPGNLIAPEKPWQGVVACNDAGYEWPGELEAWASLHCRFMETKGWRAERARRGYPEARRHIGHHEAFRGSLGKKAGLTPDLIASHYCFPGQPKSGSSGLFAAKVALIDLGFDRAVLCGIPMNGAPHFFGGDPWKPYEGFRRSWLEVPEEYRARMRSMSGWTRILLGPPETEGNHDAT